jgi:hypothetical protein
MDVRDCQGMRELITGAWRMPSGAASVTLLWPIPRGRQIAQRRGCGQSGVVILLIMRDLQPQLCYVVGFGRPVLSDAVVQVLIISSMASVTGSSRAGRRRLNDDHLVDHGCVPERLTCFMINNSEWSGLVQ